MKLIRFLIVFSAIIAPLAYLRNLFPTSPVIFDTFIIHNVTQIHLPVPVGYTAGSIATPPQHGGVTILNASGLASYGPHYGYVGADSFSYYVCQGQNCTILSADLDVRNNAPTLGNDSYNVHGKQIIRLLTNDSDPDGDTLRLGDSTHSAIVTLPQHGGLSWNGSLGTDSYLYAANYGYVGTDSFVYTVCDELGLCLTATVTLNVINLPPTLANDSYNVHVTKIISGFLANASDPDGDNLRLGDATHSAIVTLPLTCSPKTGPESDMI